MKYEREESIIVSFPYGSFLNLALDASFLPQRFMLASCPTFPDEMKNDQHQ